MLMHEIFYVCFYLYFYSYFYVYLCLRMMYESKHVRLADGDHADSLRRGR